MVVTWGTALAFRRPQINAWLKRGETSFFGSEGAPAHRACRCRRSARGQTKSQSPKLVHRLDGRRPCCDAAAAAASPAVLWVRGAGGQPCQRQEGTRGVASCLRDVFCRCDSESRADAKSSTCECLPRAADASFLSLLGAVSREGCGVCAPQKGWGQEGDAFISCRLGRSAAAGLIPACGTSLSFPRRRPRTRLFQGAVLFPAVRPSLSPTLG